MIDFEEAKILRGVNNKQRDIVETLDQDTESADALRDMGKAHIVMDVIGQNVRLGVEGNVIGMYNAARALLNLIIEKYDIPKDFWNRLDVLIPEDLSIQFDDSGLFDDEECVNCPLGKGNPCQAGTVSPIEWDLPDYIWIPKPLGPIARERKEEKVESTRNREGCAGKAVRSGGGA